MNGRSARLSLSGAAHAASKYSAARIVYDKSFQNYKSASRSSDTKTIESLIDETYEATKSIAEAVKSTGLPPISVGSLLAPLLGIFKGKSFAPGADIAFGPREVNRVLVLAVAIAVFLAFSSFFSGMKMLKQKVDFSIEAKAVQNEGAIIPPTKSIALYLNNIKTRNIFLPFEKKEVALEDTLLPEARNITAMVKDLKLVGISWLDSPESASAMIEDTKTGNTYFLKQGDNVNDLTIKSIFADRIVLSYQGEELAIKL